MLNKTLRFLLLSLAIVFTVIADPIVISHRGGGNCHRENTLPAFRRALEAGCDALELDVQVTKDHVVVVYHPRDLAWWTEDNGPISSKTNDEIQYLDGKIPTLKEVLMAFPQTMLIIDLKSLPPEPLINALIHTVSDEEAKRLVFYSTEDAHLDLLKKMKPKWTRFEKRSLTRNRLLENSSLPIEENWIGFELKRKMTATESFALGEGSNAITFRPWSGETIKTIKKLRPKTRIVLFGINTEEDWRKAVSLGSDAVYTDNPSGIIKRLAESGGGL